ncbi:hypothetical protein BJX99DRAFT_96606 [Aspergillus californicus]
MSLVLITGATGFIGAQVALRTLEAGYTVRLAIRRDAQADKLRRIFSKHEEKLSFTVVPDISLTGAFDEALQGVEYVIHVASPLSGPVDLLTPAVKGTLSILESASKVSTIRKVVVTASVLSLVPMKPIPKGAVLREDDEMDFTIDYDLLPTLDGLAQYHASKIASYKAVLDFKANEKPSFDIVTIHPVYVFGRSLIQETAAELSGTNGMLFKSLVSDKPLFGHYGGVHVDDVAVAHVNALTRPTGSGVEGYLLSSPRRSWQDVYDFLKREFPAFPIRFDTMDTADWSVDAGKAERELGIVFKGMEVQVAEVVKQQLELRGEV